MKTDTTAISLPGLGIRLNAFRLGEFFMVAIFAIFMGLPVLSLFLSSFNVAPPGKEAVYGLENWIRSFSDPSTLSALWMSFLLSVVRLIPAMILSVTVAWLIARTDMPGGNALTSVSTPVLLYSARSRPLSIFLLEYSFTGEIERASALGLLMTAIVCLMMIVG